MEQKPDYDKIIGAKKSLTLPQLEARLRAIDLEIIRLDVSDKDVNKTKLQILTKEKQARAIQLAILKGEPIEKDTRGYH